MYRLLNQQWGHHSMLSHFSQSIMIVVFQYSNFTQSERFNISILYSAPRIKAVEQKKRVPTIKNCMLICLISNGAISTALKYFLGEAKEFVFSLKELSSMTG